MSQSDDGAMVLANHPFVDTSDAESARTRISTLLIPHDLEVHRGLLPFRAVHRFAALDAISFHYLRYEPEVTMKWRAAQRFHLLTIPISGRCRVEIDRKRVEVGPGRCFVLDPTMARRLDLVGNCEALLVKIPSAAISSRMTDSFGAPAGSAIAFQSLRAVPAEACAAMIDLVRWICRDLDHAAPAGADRIAAGLIEDLLLDAVLRSCRHNHSPATVPKQGPVPQNVRRCEEFVELHAGGPISIADMTAVSGASERMLFQDFRDHRQISPMAFLKSVRLKRAHAELASADGATHTVSQIAGAWGFAHPGRFAKDYRGRFGRNPSDTLRAGPNPVYDSAPEPSDRG